MEVWILTIWLCNFAVQGQCESLPVGWRFDTQNLCYHAGDAFIRSNPHLEVNVDCEIKHLLLAPNSQFQDQTIYNYGDEYADPFRRNENK